MKFDHVVKVKTLLVLLCVHQILWIHIIISNGEIINEGYYSCESLRNNQEKIHKIQADSKNGT